MNGARLVIALALVVVGDAAHARTIEVACGREATLRQRIGEARAGDTVHVRACVYDVTAPLVVPHGVTLVGDTTLYYDPALDELGGPKLPNASLDRTILDGRIDDDYWAFNPPPDDGNHLQRILIASAGDIAIRGFTFRSSDPVRAEKIAIYVNAYGSGRVTVEGNAFSDHNQSTWLWRAVWMENGIDAVVRNNVVRGVSVSPASGGFVFDICGAAENRPPPAVAYASRVAVTANYVDVYTSGPFGLNGVSIGASNDVAGCQVDAVIARNRFDGEGVGNAVSVSAGGSDGNGDDGSFNSARVLISENLMQGWENAESAFAAIVFFGYGDITCQGNRVSLVSVRNEIRDCGGTNPDGSPSAPLFFAASLATNAVAFDDDPDPLLLAHTTVDNALDVTLDGDRVSVDVRPWIDVFGLVGPFGAPANGSRNRATVLVHDVTFSGPGVGVTLTDDSSDPTNAHDNHARCFKAGTRLPCVGH